MDVGPRVRIALSPSPPDGGRRGANKKCREKRGAPMAAPLRRFARRPQNLKRGRRRSARARRAVWEPLRSYANALKMQGVTCAAGGGGSAFFGVRQKKFFERSLQFRESEIRICYG